jgi:hypothetical protein
MSTTLQQLTAAQTNKEVAINRNFETTSWSGVYGKKQSTSSGLTWGYYGGRWGGFTVADGTHSLTNAADNYIVVLKSNGVASFSTATTNWNNTTDYARVYKVTTAGSVVTATEDHRAGPSGVHGGGGVSSIDASAVTYTPTTLGNWDSSSDPGNADDALDELAARVVALEGGAAGDASTLTYTPTTLSDWDGSSDPGNADDAFDELAARVKVLEASPGGSGTKTYAVFTPMTSQPPASNFATLDTRNSIAVLDFDDSTEESAFWVGVMPEAASLASGLIVNIFFMATSATSGDARFGAQFERMNTDEDSDSFDTATEATVATSGTSGIVTKLAITCTTIDSIAAGEAYRLKIYRDTTGADTITGDVEVVAVELRSAA